MKLTSRNFENGADIPGEFAFAVAHPTKHISLSSNRNPQLTWSDVPAGTKSFVLICHDPDVPSRPEDVNKEGHEVPAVLPRVTFYHWLLLDIPATTREIAAGSTATVSCPGVKQGRPHRAAFDTA
jgi:phosphatidylethanolamine-binding protein (PEBP) family uncharacterized protein